MNKELIKFKHYLGLPFLLHGRDRAGLDCYGLIRLIYAELLGIDLPAYAYSDNETERADLIETEKAAWIEVPWAAAKPFDVLSLRVKNLPLHVGLCTSPPWFIHIMAGCQSVHERWDSQIWRNRRLGLYRYAV